MSVVRWGISLISPPAVSTPFNHNTKVIQLLVLSYLDKFLQVVTVGSCASLRVSFFFPAVDPVTPFGLRCSHALLRPALVLSSSQSLYTCNSKLLTRSTCRRKVKRKKIHECCIPDQILVRVACFLVYLKNDIFRLIEGSSCNSSLVLCSSPSLG